MERGRPRPQDRRLPSRRIPVIRHKAGKDAGAPIKVTGFVRYALGEGIEKKEEDFAAEVAKTVAASKAG